MTLHLKLLLLMCASLAQTAKSNPDSDSDCKCHAASFPGSFNWVYVSNKNGAGISQKCAGCRKDQSGCDCNIPGHCHAVPPSCPVLPQPTTSVTYIGASYMTTFMRLQDGSLFGVGMNNKGQLGLGDHKHRTDFVKIMSGAKGSVGGYMHTVVVKQDGSLWGTGSNENGELGDGTKTNKKQFVQLIASDVKAVASRGFNTAVLKQDGSVWTAGWNQHGQLGTNDNKPEHLNYVKVIASGVTAISASGHSTLVIKEDGSLWGVGQNHVGSLGDGTTINRMAFVKVIASGVKAVAARSHSLVIKDDSSVWATGYNDKGQLGDGSTTNRHQFKKVIASGAEAVSLGHSHSMVLKQDGSLWAAGKNDKGQLGDGTTNDRHTFVKVVASGVKAVVAAPEYTVILKTDGSVWGAGSNLNGQLTTAPTSKCRNNEEKCVLVFTKLVLPASATNKCTCTNGSPQTGAGCTKNGAAMCKSCNVGWTLNSDKTACDANTCTCTNGSPQTGADCTKNGAAMCKSCNVGWTLKSDKTVCDANTCTCTNGSPQTGADCTKNGAAMCKSCKVGWTLNSDKTACDVATTSSTPATVTIPTTAPGCQPDTWGSIDLDHTVPTVALETTGSKTELRITRLEYDYAECVDPATVTFEAFEKNDLGNCDLTKTLKDSVTISGSKTSKSANMTLTIDTSNINSKSLRSAYSMTSDKSTATISLCVHASVKKGGVKEMLFTEDIFTINYLSNATFFSVSVDVDRAKTVVVSTTINALGAAKAYQCDNALVKIAKPPVITHKNPLLRVCVENADTHVECKDILEASIKQQGNGINDLVVFGGKVRSAFSGEVVISKANKKCVLKALLTPNYFKKTSSTTDLDVVVSGSVHMGFARRRSLRVDDSRKGRRLQNVEDRDEAFELSTRVGGQTVDEVNAATGASGIAAGVGMIIMMLM